MKSLSAIVLVLALSSATYPDDMGKLIPSSVISDPTPDQCRARGASCPCELLAISSNIPGINQNVATGARHGFSKLVVLFAIGLGRADH